MSKSLQFSWLGLVKFRPFDEKDEDDEERNSLYQNPVEVLLNCFALLCLIEMLFMPYGPESIIIFTSSAAAFASINAGVYWNTGFRAKALNQLFTSVFTIGFFAFAAELL